MTLIEYLRHIKKQKTMLMVKRHEAFALDIPYPVRAGWLDEHRNRELPEDYVTFFKEAKIALSKITRERRKLYKKAATSTTYSERSNSLEANGYSSYKEYLQSDEWKAIRNTIRNKNTHYWTHCNLCGCGGKLDIHHQDYTIIGTSRLSSHLIMLCRPCHEHTHRYAKLHNIGLKKTHRRLRKDRMAKGLPVYYPENSRRVGI